MSAYCRIQRCKKPCNGCSKISRVVNGEQELFVNSHESTYIPAGHKQRAENPGGGVDLVMIEVQSGDYLVEDDIVRFEDVYGPR